MFLSVIRCPGCTAVIAWLCLVSVGVVGLALGRPVLLVVFARCSLNSVIPFLGASLWWHRRVGASEVRDGSACGPSTLRRSGVAVLAVRCRSHLVVAWSRQNGALVVLVEVLPGLACIASAVLLAAVFSLWSVLLVIWVVHSGEGSSQDRPMSLLVEVLPRSASCLFRATVVLLLWFEVCRLVGLRSGEVLSEQLLALLVEVLPKAALCSFWLSLLSLFVEMNCRCCQLDCLCYSLFGRCRSRYRVLSCVSDYCVGQLVSLVVS
ncbi:hypothetical protein Taro_002950, partial [Colocasia esculenta]|nr:hypothetical protein [Colocasia esculenta]